MSTRLCQLPCYVLITECRPLRRTSHLKTQLHILNFLTTLEKKLSDICFVGDPHGHYSHIIEQLLARQAREAIFLGDFFSDKTTRELSLLKSLFAKIEDIGIEIKFIHGNHDHHNIETANFFESDVSSMNLHGRVATCGRCDVTIGGLGGIFLGKFGHQKLT